MTKHFKYAVILVFFIATLWHGKYLQNKVLDTEAQLKASYEILERRYDIISKENNFLRGEINRIKEVVPILKAKE